SAVDGQGSEARQAELEARAGSTVDAARSPPRGKVGYVLPVTSCYPGKDGSGVPTGHPNQPRDEPSFRDFAIMLRSLVHASSYWNPAGEKADAGRRRGNERDREEEAREH
ncbi:hypothetical protein THAOC_35649, partial [Thalassiosira oceanica]